MGSDTSARDGRIGIPPIAEQQDDLGRGIARKRTGQTEHVVDAPRAFRWPREYDPAVDRTQDARESRSQAWRCRLQEERIERVANHRALWKGKDGCRRPVPIALPPGAQNVHQRLPRLTP